MTTLKSDPLPLARDARGVIRIGGTRVSLESLVASYEAGGSTQELAEAFPDLSLYDIHSTIAYYLKHREEVEEYIAVRRRAAEETEARLQEEFPDAYRRLRPAE